MAPNHLAVTKVALAASSPCAAEVDDPEHRQQALRILSPGSAPTDIATDLYQQYNYAWPRRPDHPYSA